MRKFLRTTMCASILVFLTACGGGGGDSSSSPTPPVTSPPVPSPTPTTEAKLEITPSCSGINCGAINSNTYSGSGIGIWSYENKGVQEVLLPVDITGVTGKTATVIYTNLDTKEQNLNVPPSNINIFKNVLSEKSNLATYKHENRIKKFNIDGYKAMLKNADSKVSYARVTVANNANPGDTKVWNYQDGNVATQATFTLLQQVLATDGRKINFWIDINEYGVNKVTDADITQISTKFASGSDSLYKNIVDLAGQPFGSNTYSNLIPPNNQSLNIVIANLDSDQKPYGLIGYFSSEHNFLKSSIPASNEALTVFLDSETLYVPAQGNTRAMARLSVTSALIHEFTHLTNFYQRGILKSSSFSSIWLEETSALGMEDILAQKISTTENLQRDNRYPLYLSNSSFNCSMPEWDVGCDDYQRSSTFISFLNRKYGVPFYTGLLKNFSSTNPITLMDNQIKASGGVGYLDDLKNFSTHLSLLPGKNLPAGFGFPSVVSQGYTLAEIYNDDYALYRNKPTAPSKLKENGGMYFYDVGNLINGFTQNIPVPPKTSVSIVIK